MADKTLTKDHLVTHLFSKIGLSKRVAKELVEHFFEIIKEKLEQGEEVKLCRFGKYCLRDKKERPGRNPKTKKNFTISARRVVTFQPCQKVKHMVEGCIKQPGKRNLLDDSN